MASARSVSRPIRTMGVLLAGAVLTAGSGCMTRQPASQTRLTGSAAPPTVDWPQRMLEPRTDGELFLLDQKYTLSLDDEPVETPERGAYGVGTLSSVRMDELEPGVPPPAPRGPARLTEWLIFRSLSEDTIHMRASGDDESVDVVIAAARYTELRCYEPTDGVVRGLVVHLASLKRWTSAEDHLVNALCADGWMVLSTSLPYRALLDGGPVIDRTHLDDEGAGRVLASAIDDRIADWAYAVEGTLSYLRETRPAVREGPLVLAACSLGTFAAPAVAARLGDEIDAAVLIGGGAHLLRVLRTSSLRQEEFTVQWRPSPPDGRSWPIIEASYLDASQFDGARAAGHLHDIPVLMLHARWDAIVPASTGELLWEALNRPERWVYPDGHLGLFWKLGGQSKRIVAWIDRAVATPQD